MPDSLSISEDVKKEVEKTISSLESVRTGDVETWREFKDRYLD